jgi:predicted nucleotidyltransferase
MSHEILVRNAHKRREAFKNLAEHLKTIKETIHRLDPKAEIYMFGSVAEKKHNYSSDIDILIITKLPPANVHSELWKAGIKDPFEIHVHTPEEASFFLKRTTLVKV